MNKYNTEFKLQVVKYVLEEKHGVKAAKKAFGLHSHGDIVKWVSKYQQHGLKGLKPNKFKYDGNFKKNVVEYMLENHLSLTQTAIHFNLSDSKIVSKWLQLYKEGNLENVRKERKKYMQKRKPKKNEDIDTKKLLEENEYLKMENAYLKKLNALVQERIKRENEKK